MKILAIFCSLLAAAFAVKSAFSTKKPEFPAVDNNLVKPGKVWNTMTVGQLQTNAWYQNMVLGEGYGLVNVLPYIVKKNQLNGGLSISVPNKLNYTRVVKTPFVEDWTLSVDEGKLNDPVITAADHLSLTLEFSHGANKMTVPLVRGASMISAKVEGLTPQLTTTRKITQVKTSDGTVIYPGAGSDTSDRFDITLDDQRVWTVFLSAPTLVTAGANFVRTSAAGMMNIRIAYAFEEANIATIQTYKDVVPVRGSVDYTNASDVTQITFSWDAVKLADWTTTQGNVLIYALPHHLATLQTPTIEANLVIPTIKGNMTGVTNQLWTMKENLSNVTWFMPNVTTNTTIESLLQEQWTIDASFRASSGNVYDLSASLAKMARIGLIGQKIDYTEAAVLQIKNYIKAKIASWLDGNETNTFQYDQSWGGVVTSNGLENAKADDGNGIYDDHHFQYGYLLYAAAYALKNDISDFKTKYLQKILALARDIANPSTDDTYFPVTRHKDWFAGHSWASGLVEYGDNRTQQSISEAIHAYFAIALLGDALNDPDMANYGKILAATEITAAKTYIQINSTSTIYPEKFKNYAMVGVIWDTQAYYTTWMSPRPEYIHGVQMMPFTPITTALLSQSFVQTQYSVAKDIVAQNSFILYLIMAQAVFDPVGAYYRFQKAALQLESYGATSKSEVLYWIANMEAPTMQPITS